MEYVVAVLVGQHLACPPMTPLHEVRQDATEALIALIRGPERPISICSPGHCVCATGVCGCR